MCEQRFESKRDAWLLLAGWGAVLACVAGLAPLLVADTPLAVKLAVAAVVVFPAGMVGWVSVGTYYVVTAGKLIVRSGPFCWTIEISTISDATPTRAPWSSPALSLDRLRIDYGAGKHILVSPASKQAFLRALGFVANGNEL